MTTMTDILKHLIEYKNGQEDASKLEIQLEASIKKTLQDNEYRVQLGALEKFWKATNEALLTLCQDTNEPCLVNLVKLVRNVVAGELKNQQLAIQHGTLYKIEDLISQKMSSSTDNTLILQVCTQAMCNLLTNNPTAIDFVWKIWMSNEERGSMLSLMLSKSHEGVIMSTLVLIINCIRGSKERCDLLVNRKLGQQVIAAILGDIERLHGDESSKNFELGYTVMSELITFGHFDTLFIRVDDYSDKNVLSDHQVILLKLLDSKIHAVKGSFPEFMTARELKFLTAQLGIVGNEAVKVIVAVKKQGTQMPPEQISNVYTGIVLLLEILNQVFVLDEDHVHGIKSLLVDVNALQLAIDILGHLETLKLPPSTDNDPVAGFNFLKRECVRLIGTLCYKDRTIQDKVRQLGGIPLILCQLRIDDSNPYIREYATVALRNLMEDNSQNQQIIQELEPQQVIQTKELDDMNLVPEITEDGKLHIRQRKP